MLIVLQIHNALNNILLKLLLRFFFINITTSIFKFMCVAHIRVLFDTAVVYVLKQVLWLPVNKLQEAGDVCRDIPWELLATAHPMPGKIKDTRRNTSTKRYYKSSTIYFSVLNIRNT